jgi:hypothetical protein
MLAKRFTKTPDDASVRVQRLTNTPDDESVRAYLLTKRCATDAVRTEKPTELPCSLAPYR